MQLKRAIPQLELEVAARDDATADSGGPPDRVSGHREVQKSREDGVGDLHPSEPTACGRECGVIRRGRQAAEDLL